MSNKSAELLPRIIEAKTKEESIGILNDILNILHLSTSYTKMTELRDKINIFSTKLKEEVEDLNLDDVVYEYEFLNSKRMKLAFLYTRVHDELSASVNSNKIFYEEIKTTRRAEALQNLKDSGVAQTFNAKSASALREILGADKTYSEYASEYAIAYGNYKALDSLLSSIQLWIDSISSREKRELINIQKDTK